MKLNKYISKSIVFVFCILSCIIFTSGCINFNIYHTKKANTSISDFRKYTGEDLDKSLVLVENIVKKDIKLLVP